MSKQLTGQLDLFSFEIDTEPTFDYLKAIAPLGSGFSKGKDRITRFFSEKHTAKEEAEFLKHEYGVGGMSLNISNHPEAVFLDHNVSELRISICHGDMTKDKSWEYLKYSYADLARKIHECINDGTYTAKKGW